MVEHIDVVKVLLRAGADPLLARGDSGSEPAPGRGRPGWSGQTPTFLSLNIAANFGGIEGCSSRTGGALALQVAAQSKHLEIARPS